MPLLQSFETKLQQLEQDVRKLDRELFKRRALNVKHAEIGRKNPHWTMLESAYVVQPVRNKVTEMEARRVKLATPGGRFSHTHSVRDHSRLVTVNTKLKKMKANSNIWEAARQRYGR